MCGSCGEQTDASNVLSQGMEQAKEAGYVHVCM